MCAKPFLGRLGMFEEKRASPRVVINNAARIAAIGGAGPVDCLVADISEGGVRLVVQSECPEEFELTMVGDPGPPRKCRVVWRLDQELGAEFFF